MHRYGLFAAACLLSTVWNEAQASRLISVDFNGFHDYRVSTTQYQTGHQLVYGASITNWAVSGFNAAHGMELSPGNWAVMIFGDNRMTQQAGFAANAAGTTYYMSYEVGPTVYSNPFQQTQATDALEVQVLRGDGSVLASQTVAPGAWSGTQAFRQQYLSYVGDGSGDVRMAVFSATPGSGHFAGAIADMSLWDSAPVANLPEPATASLLGLAALGLLAASRRRQPA